MNFQELQQIGLLEINKIENPELPLILVGSATCGRAAGSLQVIQTIKNVLEEKKILANVLEVGCIGLCYKEVLLDIIKPGFPRISYCNVTSETASKIIEENLLHNKIYKESVFGVFGDKNVDGINNIFDYPVLKEQVRISLRNCGYIDPENIFHYIGRGGYSGINRALSMSREDVIAEIKKSGLRGRGGAGFLTGLKWEFCYKASSETKYLICNADEGDPGAFMDRSLLEGDPHSVLEGMLIAAYAIGAKEGYIYVRAEYPLAIERLNKAISDMKKYRLLGLNILGTEFCFNLKIKEGAGAFVCGEETALIASIEGKRGMPRPRPPFPAQKGLWGKPTVINNVETFANVSAILANNADWFASYGTEKSKGTKTFALAGKINNTGLIEVPMGLPLKNIIFEIGGGIPNNKEFKAVQTGGPSGGCIPSKYLDLSIDYESLASVGSIMGSGGMVVMDEDTCMVDIARYFLDFTYKESCGKCVPCRLGTKQMLKILERITQGEGEPKDLELLSKLSHDVKSGSLCGLGQTAPNPVLTTLKYFKDEYEAHIFEKRCPAKVCKSLISYVILEDKCKACTICLKSCPTGAIIGAVKQIHKIDQNKCIKCGICLDVCPKRFNAIMKLSGKEVEING